MTHVLLIVSILACVTVRAWSADADSAGTLTPSVDYRVLKLNDRELPAAGAPTLTLDAQAKRLTGFSGINRYGGGYELAGNILTIGPTFSTMMAGEQAAMDTEREFLGVIGQPLTISAGEGGLLLRSEKGTLLLVVVTKPAK